MLDDKYLFNDNQIQDFIVNGYVTVKTDLPASFHEYIYQQLNSVVEKEGNPGNNVLPRIPEVQEVFDQPVIRGAVTSVLGPDYIMHPHRHPHHNLPDSPAQSWHKDSYWGYNKIRNHRPWWVMALYYPQDVTEEIGPTAVLPGTQYYYTCTHDDDEPGAPLFGQAGTVTIIHYDLWHRAMANRTDRHRYMLKFQFIRMEAPQHPTWNNENSMWAPVENDDPPYKHQVMWRHCWNWLSGRNGLHEKGASTREADSSGNGGVSQLIKALRDENPGLRLNAADTLGMMGDADHSVVRALIEALGDTFEPVGLNAAYALGGIGSPAVPGLRKALNHESELVHRNAAYGLSAIGAPAVPALIDALEHKLDAVRGNAAYALGEIGSPAQSAVSTLIKLLGDPSEEVRWHIVEALGIIGAPPNDVVPALMEALHDPDAQVRFTAALSLTRIGSEAYEAVPTLRVALADRNRYVRANAVDALHRIGTPEARETLFHFLFAARWCPSTTKESTF
jgi:hypothetical protein